MGLSEAGRAGAQPGARWIGPLFAVVGVFGFSAKAVLVKLAYEWHPIDAVTLLALRMIYSAPFFIAMAWWTSRPPAQRLAPAQWRRLALLGFIGYYLSSLLDFMGLAYITASLERLILYLNPTPGGRNLEWDMKTNLFPGLESYTEERKRADGAVFRTPALAP